MINFLCLHCNRKICVPDKKSGGKVNCPKCNRVNLVPNSLLENNTTNQEELKIKENHDNYVSDESGASDNIIDEKENINEQYSLEDEQDSFPEVRKISKNDTSTEFQQHGISDSTKSSPNCGKTIKENELQSDDSSKILDKPKPAPKFQVQIYSSRQQLFSILKSKKTIILIVIFVIWLIYFFILRD